MFQPQKLYSGWSATGPRTVRGSSVQPASFGYTSGLSTEHSADGPPRVRVRSTHVEKSYQRQFQSGVCGRIFRSGQSAWVSRTVRACAELWGQPRIDLYGVVSYSPPPTRTQTLKSSLLSLSSTWEEPSRGRTFVMIPGRSERITGHSARIFIMSSRYFVDSLTLVLGFQYWKELGLCALICFWAMDS